MVESSDSQNLRVCIIGAGIGGLVCAIACRLQGLRVKVLEQAPEILPIGAGIQIPPNASKVLESLGILPAILSTATEVKQLRMRRYANGALLAARPVEHDSPWLVIHRADYLTVLLNKVKELGVEIVLDAKVERVDFEAVEVHLTNGDIFKADVIIGADGLWSNTRSAILGRSSAPSETGDLAYRATFTRQQLEDLNDQRIFDLCNGQSVTVWVGPDKHCVFYPVRAGTQFNLVLLRPDDLPEGTRSVQGDIGEMRQTFQSWDPVLTKIISCIPTVLKWKLMHHAELDLWAKSNFALLGDACHPTLPYQAQGAAMAVKDGAIIGTLLGRLSSQLRTGKIPRSAQRSSIAESLSLYEKCQKRRTTKNVQGALNNRHFYHMPDGAEQEERDALLAAHTWTDESSHYLWCDMRYNQELLDVDILGNAGVMFEQWLEQREAFSKTQMRCDVTLGQE